jgi:hypothetical protein
MSPEERRRNRIDNYRKRIEEFEEIRKGLLTDLKVTDLEISKYQALVAAEEEA